MNKKAMWLALGFATVVGCAKQPVIPVTFDSGLVKSIELPKGFKVTSSSLKPWVILAEGNTNQSFSLQVVTPTDETWNNVGNLAEASKMMGENADNVVVSGRHWIIVPLNGVVAYSLENDVRIYFLGQGDWSTKTTMSFIKGIVLR
jgi:3-dehydroquinate synthase class II